MLIAPASNQITDRDMFQGARRLFLVLAAIAVVYAFVADFRTVSEPDLFWQLATGRWVAQHHRTFSVDVFSYTAQGQPWIYPVGSALLFYAAYLIGNFALISWMAALACAGTVALLVRRGSAATAATAIVAVPLLALRSAARAEMFTVILFAAYLSILWENYQTGRARLWWLPLLMVAWVNLHLGFVAGLALIVAFVGIDLLEMLFAGFRRQAAIDRLKRAWPWFASALVATLANPWGWGLYSAVLRQSRATAVHSEAIAEWGSIPLNWTAGAQAFALRSTTGTFYLLLAIAVVAVLVALFQRQIGAVILLLAAVFEGVQHVRMEALAACVVVVVGGTFWAAVGHWFESRIPGEKMRSNLATAVVMLFAIFAFVRIHDVVTDYRHHSISRFGAGLTWWVPQRAAEFVERENLPGEIFNTYDEGGYILWKLGPERRDYIDGRAIPFGTESFHHQTELMMSSPDSEMWLAEADRYDINTVILSLVRFDNWKGALKPFCHSVAWKPVYLDEVSAVIVRRGPQTADLINRLGIDCSAVALPAGPPASLADDAFNQWANAATVYAVLGRGPDALAATDKAVAIYPDDSFIHWLRGMVSTMMGLRDEAEKEYLTTVSLEPSAAMGWSSLAGIYSEEHRMPDTINALRYYIEVSPTPQPLEWLQIAGLYLQLKQPKEALKAFDKAERAAPPKMLAERGARTMKYNLATGRAEAWRALGDTKRAQSYDEEAVQDLVPQ